ncbi:MAG: hypothetical protein NTV22_10880 [bacterium]|nr:hypothetical protein [bacterium]
MTNTLLPMELLAAACIGVAMLGCSCTGVEKAGAGAALPLAAVGDTLVLPVQGLGRTSEALMRAGDRHSEKVAEEDLGNDVTAQADQWSTIVYYAPGVALWPFQKIAPAKLYPMTKGCFGVLEYDPAATNAAAGTVRDRAPEDTFEEW